MGPTCGRQDPGGPHVGPMNFASYAWENVKDTKSNIYFALFNSMDHLSQPSKSLNADQVV